MKKNTLLFALMLTGLFFNIANVQASTKKEEDANTYELLNLLGEVLERTKHSFHIRHI